jgi:hypothetical protein
MRQLLSHLLGGFNEAGGNILSRGGEGEVVKSFLSQQTPHAQFIGKWRGNC